MSLYLKILVCSERNGCYSQMLISNSKRMWYLKRVFRCRERYFSFCRLLRYPVSTEISQRNKYFSQLLGVSIQTAVRKLEFYDNVKTKPFQAIQDTVQTLKELGITETNIAQNLQVLSCSSAELKLRYLCLQELGFQSIECPELICYKSLLRLNTEDLHAHGILLTTVDPLTTVLRNLRCRPEFETSVMELSCSLDVKKMPLQVLRELIMKQILVYFSPQSSEEVQTCLDDCKSLKSSSLTAVKHVLEIYLRDIGLDFIIIQKSPTLLSVPVDNLMKLMNITKSYPIDLERVLTHCPLIASRNPDCVEEVCRILSDYEIPFKHLDTLPSVLLLMPQYVSDALLTLHTWADFTVLKSHPKFLHLIKNYKKANLYLEYLQKAGFERCNINLLVSSNKRFKHHLYVGEESQSCKEMVTFLAEKLDFGVRDVECKLRCHPSFRKISVARMKTTLEFLFSKGFTKEQIFNGLALILYPKTKVAKFWSELPTLPSLRPFTEWRHSPNILQLLLYVIEKEECIFFKPTNIPTKDLPIS